MNKHRFDRLQTELVALDDLLKIVPEEAVIDRISLEERRSRIEPEARARPTSPTMAFCRQNHVQRATSCE